MKIRNGRWRMLVYGAGCLFGASMAGSAERNFDQPASSDTAQQFDAGNVQRQDTPTDPDYDCAELDSLNPQSCSNLYDERFDLFGFPSQLTRLTALYSDPADAARVGKPQVSGFNAAGAWKTERGRPDVSVAILDTGIRWNKTGLRRQLRLNRGELPLPRRADGSTLVPAPANLDGYDADGNAVFDVDDYAADGRVDPNAGPNGVANAVDGQDLLRTFSDGSDADANGYVDDIAGWDWFDDDNDAFDASSYFAAGNHGTGRTDEAVERGNETEGSIGVCPKCTFVPLRIWDTFVSDANTFGLAVAYAADNGIQVIEGANGSLYHSAFMEAASDYAWTRGAVQTYSGDDLNTGNHNYPAAYTHALLIEGTVQDNVGLGSDSDDFQQGREFFCQGPLAAQCPGSNLPVQTYFRGANTTQFGGKSSISLWGTTGSQNTGRAAGAAALVISAGLDFSPSLPLSPDEVREILEQTAEDVTQPNTVGSGNPDFAQPGWDSHFGWGRVNLGAAVQAVKDGNIPPEAVIITPDWYAPLTGATVKITGLARARRANGGNFDYRLEWGPGVQPSSWTLIRQQTNVSGTVTDLGEVDLAAVRAALVNFVPPADPGDATFAPNSRHPLKDHFTVRLTVTDPDKPNGLRGVDRKVLTALPDGQGLVAGFPKRLGSGGEGPIRYADLNGDNIEELIVPAQDGVIHAYRPDGTELPGWPVRTGFMSMATTHLAAPVFAQAGLPVPREPPRGPTIADLDNNGRRQLVTAAGRHVYVFNADGSMRAGFPVKGDDALCAPDKQRQEDLHPKCGFVATPALAWLDGRGPGKKPAIVVPSLDGHLYAWNGDGSKVAWSPRRLQEPSLPSCIAPQVAESINNPAIGDLNGDGKDDIVVGSNEVYPLDCEPPPAPDQADVAFGAIEEKATRLYGINGADGTHLPGWPIPIRGIIQDILPFIGPGHDAALLKVNGEQQIVASATGTGVPGVGSGLSTYNAAGERRVEMRQDARGGASNATDTSGAVNLFEYAVVGDLLGAGSPAIVKYELSRGQLVNLAAAGQNVPYNHLIGAWDAATGANLNAFPTITDDYQFVSSSTVARMSAALPTQQVVAGTGLGLVHAYDGQTGLDIAGFPKVTGGWLFAPVALSATGRMAAITREGFLFEWATGQPACQTEWPSFRHDEQGSGNYDRDGTYPGSVVTLATSRDAAGDVNVQWTAPGDDALCGTASQYLVGLDGAAPTVAALQPRPAGSTETLKLPNPGSGTHTVSVQAVDEAGNLGHYLQAAIAAFGGGGALSGVVLVTAPGDVEAGPGAAVDVGTFRLRNTGTQAQSVTRVTLQVSDPAAFDSMALHVPGGAAVVARPVQASTTFEFAPVTLAAGAEADFDVTAVLSSESSGTRTAASASWMNLAHAAGDHAPQRRWPAALALLLGLAVLASRFGRLPASLTLAAGLMLAGCDSDEPSSSSQAAAPPPAFESLTSTVDITAVTAQSGGQAVSYTGLPARLATVVRSGS